MSHTYEQLSLRKLPKHRQLRKPRKRSCKIQKITLKMQNQEDLERNRIQRNKCGHLPNEGKSETNINADDSYVKKEILILSA